MTNSEDVLERAEREIANNSRFHCANNCGCDRCDLLRALAAEVRELCRDRARLDWLETIIAMRKIVGGPWEGCLPSTHSISAHSLRDLADATMDGGED